MKTCPTCKRTYADHTISFCLEDGAVLSAPYDSQPTRPYPPSREPAPTEIMHPPPGTAETIPSPPPVFGREERKTQQSKSARKRWPLVAAAVFVVAAGLIIAVAASKWIVKHDGLTAKEPVKSALPRDPTPNPPSRITSETPSKTPRSESSPENTPEPRLEIAGTWIGTYDGDPARLVITDKESNSFTGTLTSKYAQIAVSGYVDPATREISYKETRVIRDSEGDWILGTNRGSISPNGRKMSGKGKANGTYSWTFSKE